MKALRTACSTTTTKLQAGKISFLANIKNFILQLQYDIFPIDRFRTDDVRKAKPYQKAYYQKDDTLADISSELC